MKTNCAQTFFLFILLGDRGRQRMTRIFVQVTLRMAAQRYRQKPRVRRSVTPVPTQSQPPYSNRLCAFCSTPRCSGSRLFSFGQKCTQKKKPQFTSKPQCALLRRAVIRSTATASERVISYAGVGEGGSNRNYDRSRDSISDGPSEIRKTIEIHGRLCGL